MVGWQSKQGKCISFEKSDQIEKLLFLSIMQIFQEFFDRLISHGTRKLTYYSNLIKFILSNYSIQMVLLFHFFWKSLILRIFWTSRFKKSSCVNSKRPCRLTHSLLNRVPDHTAHLHVLFKPNYPGKKNEDDEYVTVKVAPSTGK